ncbi:MAG: TraR/DksA C4-type zinc finger protein [Rubrivivax sp.]
MTAPLNVAQRERLRAELQQRRQRAGGRLGELSAANARSENVHEVLSQDADEPSQREDERAIGMALGDIDRAELTEIDAALRRMDEDRYGLCIDCENDIPFARLQAEPAALRCVACEQRHEAVQRRRG